MRSLLEESSTEKMSFFKKKLAISSRVERSFSTSRPALMMLQSHSATRANLFETSMPLLLCSFLERLGDTRSFYQKHAVLKKERDESRNTTCPEDLDTPGVTRTKIIPHIRELTTNSFLEVLCLDSASVKREQKTADGGSNSLHLLELHPPETVCCGHDKPPCRNGLHKLYNTIRSIATPIPRSFSSRCSYPRST